MTETFSASRKVMTFIVVRDRDAAKQFYGETLGFRQTDEDAYAVVFDLDGTMLRITTLKDHQPVPYTVLGWEVTDIVSSVKALMARGIHFIIYEGLGQDALGIWTAPNGNKVAWFLDPEGNNLSLTEF
jgi:catechol 2,3-dioxygenase-like lactoylglutathione lyase family enzyme